MAARRKPTPPAPQASPEEPSFEVALERLEEIVDRLEQGDLDLEAALAAFEEGVRLSRLCAGQLDAAERRIEILVREAGEWVARPFEEAAALEAEGADAGEDGEDPDEDGEDD